MIFLINSDFDTVTRNVNFPCRIAKFHDKCVMTTHQDHDNLPSKYFDVLMVRSSGDYNFDYNIPEWIYLALGCPDHLHSYESECFATITDGVYCQSVRGQLMTLGE